MDKLSEAQPGRLNGLIVTIAVIALLLLSCRSEAATITATASGNWTTNSTWSCGCQPTSSDNIVIPSGITVATSGPVILFLGPVITITIGGTLVLNNGGSLQVDSSDVIKILSGGKINATGAGFGSVFSGVVPIFIASGTSINGPETITNGTLPVRMLFFKGEILSGKVTLTWASATEKNFDFYSIDRSTDGRNFTTIAEVKGSGTSTSRHDYQFTDNFPCPGVAYYRLRATDLDGTFESLNVIRIETERLPFAVEIYPNPITGNTFSTRLNFVPAEVDELAVYDSQGVCVFRSPLGNNPETIFQLAPAFGKGLYFLSITTGSGVLRTRLAAQ